MTMSEKNLQLINAIKQSDKNLIKKLINKGADLEFADSEDKTPLMHAIDTGSLEIVNLIIDCGADVNFKNSKDETALMYAAMHSTVDIMTVLITNLKNLKPNNQATILSQTLLSAIQYHNTEIFNEIYKNHINTLIKHTNSIVSALLNHAIEHANINCLESIYKAHKKDIHEKYIIGHLKLACKQGDVEVLNYLLEYNDEYIKNQNSQREITHIINSFVEIAIANNNVGACKC